MRRITAPMTVACLAGVVAVTGLDAAGLGNAQAQVITRERPPLGPPKLSVVVAHSRWGHGSVSGPVRRARHGG
jgi:hypothetical protein